MNAYELADAVEDWETGANYTVSIKAAQMLRQQADRITELEGELSRHELRDLEHTSRIADLENRCLDLCFSETYANQSTKVTENSLLNIIAKLEKEKIRAYDNGYEDGRKPNTQESDYVKNVKKAAAAREEG